MLNVKVRFSWLAADEVYWLQKEKKMFKCVKCRGQHKVFSQGSLYNYKAALENLASWWLVACLSQRGRVRQSVKCLGALRSQLPERQC